MCLYSILLSANSPSNSKFLNNYLGFGRISFTYSVCLGILISKTFEGGLIIETVGGLYVEEIGEGE